jgi:hypothetical protein
VREDYSADGRAWEYFPHDHARSRAYRWNEDAIAGFCDRDQHLCLGVALWNERDAILKERLFGLSNSEGNHGEDVKEYYFYLDNTPTHSYARMLYKYPQVAFPYDALVAENTRRGRYDPEYELFDALETAFREHEYFDVFVEYAKLDVEDIACRIRVVNRSTEAAPIHVLPQLWYRNTWSWQPGAERHVVRAGGADGAGRAGGTDEAAYAWTRHAVLGERYWYVSADNGQQPEWLFTENDTNAERLFGTPNATPYVKDGINDAVVHGRRDRVNDAAGSKVAAHVRAIVEPGATFTVCIRFSPRTCAAPFAGFDLAFARRAQEADEFYAAVQAPHLTADERHVQRQALAGLLWSKQFYHFNVHRWLTGDPAQPAPPQERRRGRNAEWAINLHNADIILMPDKWEYPWYASWDLAFHVVVMALIDPEFAKRQILLLMQPRYQHPYGAIPAYEWDFNAVNPPVLAWAAWQVYQLDQQTSGREGDDEFLAAAFDGLVLMLGWWANRKDSAGNGIFGGGFLGLDNIGIFDRDRPLPTGGSLEQSDGTGWMAMFQLNMTAIAVRLARTNARYEPYVHRFGQHFTMVANVMHRTGGSGLGLWNEEDRFYFDAIRHGADHLPLKVYSLVGLVPLFATTVVQDSVLATLPRLMVETNQVLSARKDLHVLFPTFLELGVDDTRLLSVVNRERLVDILRRVLDEDQFLSEYGVRSLSRAHAEQPYEFIAGGERYEVRYLPGVSDSRMFGGNSNWRGPIWVPMNFLLIQAIATFGRYYGDTLEVECPTGSGRYLTLAQVAEELAARLTRIFLRDARDGRRAVFGDNDHVQSDPHWRDYLTFNEFFHGDSGAGLGASHQTGWTALVALLLQFGGRVTFESGGACLSAEASAKAEAPPELVNA